MSLLQETIARIKTVDTHAMAMARKRLDSLTKPRGSLGALEDIAARIAGMTGNHRPVIRRKTIITIAGDHGVVKEGVSAFPQEVTPQMVLNFLNGGAAINVLSRHAGAKVVVMDAGVAGDMQPHPGLVAKKIARGTNNIAAGPAMTRENAIKAVEAGIEVALGEIDNGADILGTGEMGIGNTTPSSAIVAAVTGSRVEDVTGCGTGLDEKGRALKIAVIKKALTVNKPDVTNGLDVLSCLGGYEIGAMAGVFLAGASRRVPVVIDGFISGAAALTASLLCPEVKGYMIASHCSVEKGHRVTLDYLRIPPLFDFSMRLGEGTGAAFGIMFAEASLKILNEMATFEEAQIKCKA